MAEEADISIDRPGLVRLTADIAAAYVAYNETAPAAIPELIRSIHGALGGLNGEAPAASDRPRPAVPVNKSIGPDYIVCLEDGQKLKMLKRYLRTRYDLSPEEYRKRWGLPADYPMVAPSYAQRRSEFAKSIGLGKGVRRRAA